MCVHVEAVQSLLASLAAGGFPEFPRIDLSTLTGQGGGWRLAPSAIKHSEKFAHDGGRPSPCLYTAESVASFNGWDSQKAKQTLYIIEAIERGIVTLADLACLVSPHQWGIKAGTISHPGT